MAEPLTLTETSLSTKNRYSSADLVEIYLLSLQSESSRQAMRESLKRAASAIAAMIGLPTDKSAPELIDWTSLDNAAVTALRARLLKHADVLSARGPRVDGYSISTVQMTLSAVRGLLKTAAKNGMISYDQLQRATDIGKLKGFRLPKGRALEVVEIQRLASYADEQSDPYRSFLRALFGVLIGAGARREEVCNLTTSSYQGKSLTIIGKGNKERSVPLMGPVVEDLDEWLQVRENLGLRASTTLFTKVYKDGRFRRQPLTSNGIWIRCRDVSESAGIQRLSPHDCRRTCISRMLDEGIDLALVQHFAGHENPKTTSSYDRRGDQALRKAVDNVSNIWPRRSDWI